jgi:hypothetical protein
VVTSPIVICDSTQASWAGVEGLPQRQAEALEGAQLVREDLLGRVDPDDTVQRLLRSQLLGVLDDEVHDD